MPVPIETQSGGAEGSTVLQPKKSDVCTDMLPKLREQFSSEGDRERMTGFGTDLGGIVKTELIAWHSHRHGNYAYIRSSPAFRWKLSLAMIIYQILSISSSLT